MGYRSWRARRSFIAEEVSSDGSFLDIGCGSGFLVACLMVWSNRNLRGFGVDVDLASIELARSFFASRPWAFVASDFRDFDFRSAGWPDMFEYIYWNVPNNWPAQQCVEMIHKVWKFVGSNGRLILAQYGEGFGRLSVSQTIEAQRKMLERWSELERTSSRKFDRLRWSSLENIQSIAVLLKKSDSNDKSLDPPCGV